MTSLPPEMLRPLVDGNPDAFRIAADWLLERGDVRGEFAQYQQLVETRVNPAARRNAKLAVERLQAEYGDAWEDPLIDLGVTRVSFRRGFVDEVWLPESALGNLPRLFELEPIRCLRVTTSDGATLNRAMRSAAFSQISVLHVVGPFVPVSAPHLNTLVLSQASHAMVENLHLFFPALSVLGVSRTEGGEAAIHSVAVGQLSLTRLWAANAQVHDDALRRLAASEVGLEELDLDYPASSASTLRILGSSSALRSLSRLVLTRANAHDFLAATGLPALRKLRCRSSKAQRTLMAQRGIQAF